MKANLFFFLCLFLPFPLCATSFFTIARASSTDMPWIIRLCETVLLNSSVSHHYRDQMKIAVYARQLMHHSITGGVLHVAYDEQDIIGAVSAFRKQPSTLGGTNVLVRTGLAERNYVAKSLLGSLLHRVSDDRDITKVEAGPIPAWNPIIALYKASKFQEKQQKDLVLGCLGYEPTVTLVWEKNKAAK